MQYNESQYNGDEYNLTNYTATLTESITPSDGTVAKSMSIVKTDSQAAADALSDGISLTAFLDTITILQRAHTPFAYNNGMYNQYMYNSRLDEDEVLLMATKVLSASVTASDFMQPFSISKKILESLSETDTILFSTETTLDDFVFLSELMRIEITNKALNDTLRISDWLSIKRNPQNVEWYD